MSSAPAASTSTAPSPITTPLLLVLASLAAVAPVTTDLYLPGFPALGDELGVEASAVQLTLTAFLAGLALGQMLMGPLSDRYGRRRPLIISAAVCVVAGAVAAAAPTLEVLVGARLVQGVAGAGGMVIGRAVIADLVTGRAAAKAFTLMITVGGVAPVLAPLVGGILSDPIGWRGMLWTVTGLCAAMFVGVVLVLPETRPAEVRAVTSTSYVESMRIVARSRGYWGPVAISGLSFGMLMAYIASSPFIYQNVVGLSEIGYGLAFGVNACALIGTGFATSRLIDRFDPRAMIRVAIAVQLLAACTYLLLAWSDAPPWTFMVAILVAVGSNGAIMGNSSALAMSQVRPVAGMGSAILGFTQFAVGALISPLVGLGGEESALVPAVVMATCSLASFTVSRATGPRP